jgi:hypothetical protein
VEVAIALNIVWIVMANDKQMFQETKKIDYHRGAVLGFMVCVIFLLSACGGDSNDFSGGLDTQNDSGNLILSSSHGGEGAAWGLPDCATCHPVSVIHNNARNIKSIVEEKSYASCIGCHGDNGTGKERPCLMCHNDQNLPEHPQQGGFAHGFISGDPESLDDTQCVACHQASDMNGQFSINRDLTNFPDQRDEHSDYVSISEFCLRCHNQSFQQSGFEITNKEFDDPLIAMNDMFKFVDKHGQVDGSGQRLYAGLRDSYTYQSVVECSDCHAMHGSKNKHLIVDTLDKGISRLDESTHYDISISEGNSAQLCVMCHNMTVVSDDGDLDTGNGLSGVHDISSDCQQCHRHGETVQAGF